jgi:transposase-like protein
MGRHVWPQEVKLQAIELLSDPELSYYDVHKATGVPASTLCDWAAAAGMVGHSDRVEATKAAREQRSARIELKRAVVVEKLLDTMESLIDRSEDAKPRDAQALVMAARQAQDGFRLEMGEATSRVESRDLGSAQKAKQKVDELAERRTKKSA